MRIADAHCDTLYEMAICHTPYEDCCVTLDRMKAGEVCLQTFALFCGKKGTEGTPYLDGVNMLKASYELPLPILREALPEGFPTQPTGIISCEGGEMLEGSVERLHEFDRDSRLRMIALTWNYENELGYPGKSGSPEGLKPAGKNMLRAMDQLGVLPDCSHLNDAGFWDVCEYASLPPIASHSNCRWLCGHSRNLTRDMVKAIVEKKGFIGINFYKEFLVEDGRCTLDDVLRHIDALCELGAEDVIGFGSDFDGIDTWPEELASPADFPNLLNALKDHGYTEAQLEKFSHGNLWRVLKNAEKVRKV